MDEQPDALREQAMSFYNSVQAYEQHFNQIEFEVRKLASTWLLASFAAIAYLMRGALPEVHSLAGSLALVVAVSALAQIGLFMLWILDQIVYHGLLDAAFTAALHIERRYQELPPLRSLMMRISAGGGDGESGTGMARYMKLFYLLPMVVFAGLACWGSWQEYRRLSQVPFALIAISLLVIAAPLWVLVKTRMIDAGKRRNRPSSEGQYANRPYEVAVERWLGEMARTPQ